MNPSTAALSCAAAVLLTLVPHAGAALAVLPAATASPAGTEPTSLLVETRPPSRHGPDATGPTSGPTTPPETSGPTTPSEASEASEAPVAPRPTDLPVGAPAHVTPQLPGELPRTRATRSSRRSSQTASRSSRTTRTAQERADEQGARALAALHYPYRDLGYDIAFHPYQGHQLGTTNSRTHQITVFVKDGQSDTSVRITLAHELGHALDFGYGNAERHRQYRQIRHLEPDTDWYPRSGCTDYQSDAGDWAEVFAVSLAGASDFRSERGPAPTPQQLEQLEALFHVPTSSAPPTASPSPSASPTASPSTGLPLEPAAPRP